MCWWWTQRSVYSRAISSQHGEGPVPVHATATPSAPMSSWAKAASTRGPVRARNSTSNDGGIRLLARTQSSLDCSIRSARARKSSFPDRASGLASRPRRPMSLPSRCRATSWMFQPGHTVGRVQSELFRLSRSPRSLALSLGRSGRTSIGGRSPATSQLLTMAEMIGRTLLSRLPGAAPTIGGKDAGPLR